MKEILILILFHYTPNKVTLPLGLLGYCATKATTSPVKEVAYRVNNILQLQDFVNPQYLMKSYL